MVTVKNVLLSSLTDIYRLTSIFIIIRRALFSTCENTHQTYDEVAGNDIIHIKNAVLDDWSSRIFSVCMDQFDRENVMKVWQFFSVRTIYFFRILYTWLNIPVLGEFQVLTHKLSSLKIQINLRILTLVFQQLI